MLVIRVVLVVLAVSTPALAQTTAAPDDPKAQAFYEFMMARRLDASGDAAGSMAALRRAQQLDPDSAEIAAEMAGAHARQDQAQPDQKNFQGSTVASSISITGMSSLMG